VIDCQAPFDWTLKRPPAAARREVLARRGVLAQEEHVFVGDLQQRIVFGFGGELTRPRAFWLRPGQGATDLAQDNAIHLLEFRAADVVEHLKVKSVLRIPLSMLVAPRMLDNCAPAWPLGPLSAGRGDTTVLASSKGIRYGRPADTMCMWAMALDALVRSAASA